MTIVSRGNRSGKGFDQETHYITYLFSGLVSNIKINLFGYQKKNIEVNLKSMKLQTDDPLDDCYIEFVNQKRELKKACIDAKSSLTFNQINENKEATVSKLIKKIIDSIPHNKYDFFIIPYTSEGGSDKSTKQKDHWDTFHIECREKEFEDFEKEYYKKEETKKEFVNKFMKNFNIDLKTCFYLFRKTCFISTDLHSSNSYYIDKASFIFKRHFKLQNDFQSSLVFRLAHYFITNSKYTGSVNVEDFIKDPVLIDYLTILNLENKKDIDIINEHNNVFDFFLENLKDNIYNPVNLKEFNEEIKEFENYNKNEKIKFFNLIEKQNFFYFDRNIPVGYDNDNSEEFILESLDLNKKNFPAWFDDNIIEYFYYYLYKKKQDNNIDDFSFINEKNYEPFIILLNKLKFKEEVFSTRKKELIPLYTWLCLITLEKYIYISDNNFIMPSIFKSFDFNIKLNILDIIKDFENIINNILNLNYKSKEYLLFYKSIDSNNGFTEENTIRNEIILNNLKDKNIIKSNYSSYFIINSFIKFEDIKNTILNIQDNVIKDLSFKKELFYLISNILKEENKSKNKIEIPRKINYYEEIFFKYEDFKSILGDSIFYIISNDINNVYKSDKFIIKNNDNEKEYKFILPIKKETISKYIINYFSVFFDDLYNNKNYESLEEFIIETKKFKINKNCKKYTEIIKDIIFFEYYLNDQDLEKIIKLAESILNNKPNENFSSITDIFKSLN